MNHWPLYGMFPLFDLRPRSAAEVVRLKAEREAMLAAAVPWREDLPWQPHLVLKAETWPDFDLFPEIEPLPPGYSDRQVHDLVRGKGSSDDERFVARSPSDRFAYVKRVLPRGEALSNGQGKREGTVRFDGPVVIPVVWERRVLHGEDGKELLDDQGGFVFRDYSEPRLWMSNTPFERFTLRDGVKVSKGHSVVCGLGLGWQLVQIANRPKAG